MKTHNVIPYNVVIAVLCKKFDREPSHIPDSVCTALFPASGAQTEQHRSFLAHAIEELGRRERGYIIGDLELSPRTSCFGMNNSAQC